MLTREGLEQKLMACRAEQRTLLQTREDHLQKARECEVLLMQLQGRVLQLEECLDEATHADAGQEA